MCCVRHCFVCVILIEGMCGCNKNRVVRTKDIPATKSLPALINRSRSTRPGVASPVVLAKAMAVADTSIWGPSLWKVLHTASVLSNSDTQMEVLAAVLGALRTGIPCSECSAHYNQWYDAHPLKTVTYSGKRSATKVFRIIRTTTTTSTTTWNSLVAWILDLHNNVNVRRGLPTWTVEQVVEAYGSLADAIAATNVLRGVIGDEAYSAITSMLNALVV